MNDMIQLITSRIQAGNGPSLTLTGMAIVFCGLIILMLSMKVLGMIVTSLQQKKPVSRKGRLFRAGDRHNRESADASNDDEEDMKKIAAAITMAFHLHNLRYRNMKLTIRRINNSPWKQYNRQNSMY